MFSDSEREVILFAGPTLYAVPRADALARGITVLPPVRRRDVEEMMAARPEGPGVVVIADGGFHQCLAVGHAEIRQAVERGWAVWGVSSMGAIRAYELRRMGMRGFGRVYERFLAEDDFQDDEVALLHEAGAPYRSFSEPLIHMRAAIESWTADGLLAAAASARIVDHLKALWYGDRTLELFRRLVLDAAPLGQRARLLEELAGFDRFRVKSLDLARLLRERPWEADRAQARASCS